MVSPSVFCFSTVGGEGTRARRRRRRRRWRDRSERSPTELSITASASPTGSRRGEPPSGEDADSARANLDAFRADVPSECVEEAVAAVERVAAGARDAVIGGDATDPIIVSFHAGTRPYSTPGRRHRASQTASPSLSRRSPSLTPRADWRSARPPPRRVCDERTTPGPEPSAGLTQNDAPPPPPPAGRMRVTSRISPPSPRLHAPSGSSPREEAHR